MPDLRPRSDLRSSSRYNRNHFLFGSDVYSDLEDGQIPASIRTNVAPARRGRRGRGRGRAAAGAPRPPPPPTDAQQQETSAENGDAQDIEGSPNGNVANGNIFINDEITAMGLVNAEQEQYLRSIRVTIAAIYSVLPAGTLNVLKETHAEEPDAMLKAMISHAENCNAARAVANIDSEVSHIRSNTSASLVAEGSGEGRREGAEQPRSAGPAAAAASSSSSSSSSSAAAAGPTPARRVTSPPRSGSTNDRPSPAPGIRVTSSPRSGSSSSTNDRPSMTPQQTPRRVNDGQANSDRRAAVQREFNKMDAEKRKYNVIIHGIPETDRAGDENNIYQILCHLQCANRLQQIDKMYRLGKKQYRKKRMLLIEFSSKNAVREVLEKSPRLTNSGVFGNAFIRRDMTISERQQTGRDSHFTREAAHGPEGVGPRTQDRPRTPVGSPRAPDTAWRETERSEEWLNRRQASRGPNRDIDDLISPRPRRTSIQSYNYAVSESDASSICTDTEDDFDDTENETEYAQGVDSVPMYVKRGGRLYLVTDSWTQERSGSNDRSFLTAGWRA